MNKSATRRMIESQFADCNQDKATTIISALRVRSPAKSFITASVYITLSSGSIQTLKKLIALPKDEYFETLRSWYGIALELQGAELAKEFLSRSLGHLAILLFPLKLVPRLSHHKILLVHQTTNRFVCAILPAVDSCKLLLTKDENCLLLGQTENTLRECDGYLIDIDNRSGFEIADTVFDFLQR